MVTLHVFMPEVPVALWNKMRWRHLNAKSRSAAGHIGRFNLEGIELTLFRFLSAGSPFCEENLLRKPLTPRDFDLSIQFNPTTLDQDQNVFGDDGSTVLRAILKAQGLLQALGLHYDLLELPLSEIHLTRDVIWHAEPGSLLPESDREWEAMNQTLRVMEWGRALYAREFENYTNDSPPESKFAQRRNVGLIRGSKFSKWVVYDKVQEYQSKKKKLPFMTGRLMRVEWRIKGKSQIQERLKIRNLQDWILMIYSEVYNQSNQIRAYLEDSKQGEFNHLMPIIACYSPSETELTLLQKFDAAFVQTFFTRERAYTKRMPTLAPVFVEAVAKYFVSDGQLACLDRLKQGNPITRPDTDILIVVLNGIGAARTRSILRDAFRIDIAKEEGLEVSRSAHDACARMLSRLRAGARYNAHYTWSELHQWMSMEWNVACGEEIEALDSVRYDGDVLSGQDFRMLAAPLLEQITNYPHITDVYHWAGNSIFKRMSADGKYYLIPEDLIRVYGQMKEVEQMTVENPKIRYSDEQKLVIWRARELEILPLLPQTKKRAARIKAPNLPGV